jgi:hypothetical protein
LKGLTAKPNVCVNGQKILTQILQWVENNPTNIRIFPTNIQIFLPRGTTLTAFADVGTDVAGC